jgi:RNase P/RNase MRP subunit p30
MELVFPKENEEELVTEAHKLGFTEVILCYKTLPRNHTPLPKTKTAILLEDRRKIASLRKQADLLLGPAKREFFEDKRIDAILGPGLEPRKDHTHFRRSLTQVEAELARKTKKTVFFNFTDLLASKRPEELLGRWAQDVRVLKKYKANVALVSGAKNILGMRSRKDLDAVWRAIK